VGLNKVSDERFTAAVQSSISINQVIKKLGLKSHGGNHQMVKSRIKKLGLDTSHMAGQAWSKDVERGPKHPIDDYLSNQRHISSTNLLARLINEGLVKPVCSVCGLSEWCGQSLPMRLHHKDHNYKNNNMDNLVVVCSNCFQQCKKGAS